MELTTHRPVGTSLAICLPLLLLAFNAHRMPGWRAALVQRLRRASASSPSLLVKGVLLPILLLLLALAVLVPLWTATATLASAIKAAVTVCVVLLVLGGLVACWLAVLIDRAFLATAPAGNDDGSEKEETVSTTSLSEEENEEEEEDDEDEDEDEVDLEAAKRRRRFAGVRVPAAPPGPAIPWFGRL
jgi:small-conductance mechanosensitive channel